MAKFVFVAALLLVAVAASTAAPAEESKDLGPTKGARAFEGQQIDEKIYHIRQRRSTCDGVLGSAACSTSCITSGKTGGSCVLGACVCNSENIKDVLD